MLSSEEKTKVAELGEQETALENNCLPEQILSGEEGSDTRKLGSVVESLPNAEEQEEVDFSDDEKAVLDAGVEVITQKHAEYNLLRSQPKNVKDYMQQIIYTVKISQLYEVVDSCVYDMNSVFCPVLLRIKNEKIKAQNGGLEYLLQVWSNRGMLVYEKQLSDRPSDWNISTDKFVFMEQGIPDKVSVVKLELCKRPTLFEFSLPKDIADNVAAAYRKDATNDRASDITRHVDFLDGYILIAAGRQLSFADISHKGFSAVYDETTPEAQHNEGDSIVQVAEDEVKFSTLDIAADYRVVALQQMGNDITYIVIEHEDDHKIRFLRTYFKDTDGQPTVKLVQLGLLVNRAEREAPGELVKYKSVMRETEDGKLYMVGLVLRADGGIEFYSDFMLVSEFYEPDRRCIDIDCDFNLFYFRFENKQTGALETAKCPQEWRNRIGMKTSTRFVKKDYKFEKVLHRRISVYFNLYSGIASFGTYLLVSHLNHISVFDMSKQEWVHDQLYSFPRHEHIRMLAVKSGKRHRRQNEEEKQEHQKEVQTIYKAYNILVQTGANKFVTLGLKQATGRLQETRKMAAQNKEQVIRTYIDQQNACGIVYLSAERELQDLFEVRGRHLIKTADCDFSSCKVSLRLLKKQKFYELADSTVDTAIAHDMEFSVFRASNELLNINAEGDVQASTEELDLMAALQQAEGEDGKKGYAKILMMSSKSKEYTRIVPLLKYRDSSGQLVVKLRKSYHVDLQYLQGEHGNLRTSMNGSFSCQSPEFGDNVNNYAQVTYGGINIYDAQHQIRLRHFGTNIKSCLYVDDSYLYCLADPVIKAPEIQDMTGEAATLVPDHSYKSSGLYVYDVSQLLAGRVECYKLYSSVVGASRLLDASRFSNRVAFLSDFSNIQIIPYPHENLTNFVGMGQKQEYLIWRQKDGFFTALDKRGHLLTWSCVTGSLLYTNVQEATNDAHSAKISKYKVYRSDPDDNNYTRDYYRFEDRTVQLLISNKARERGPGAGMANGLGGPSDSKANFTESIEPLPQDLFTTNSGQSQAAVSEGLTEHEWFHFKVMELKTASDRDGSEECNLLFHFDFKMIKPKIRKLVQDLDSDVSANPVQRLILSKDTRLLMEVINHFIAEVYERVDIDESGAPVEPQGDSDHGQKVRWVSKYKLRTFPMWLSKLTSQNYLFSPNFMYQLDFIYERSSFCIRITETQELAYEIPSDLLDLTIDNNKSFDAVQVLASRIWFHDESHLRIINKYKIDCMFRIEPRVPDEEDSSLITFELVSAVKVDNMHTNLAARDNSHVSLDPMVLKQTDTLERLIRMNQRYKVNVTHAVNSGVFDRRPLEHIFTIDYLQPWHDKKARFDCEQTFTLLSWIIMEKIVDDSSFELEYTDNELQIQFCFNILPLGRTILHLLALGATATDRDPVDQVTAIKQVHKLFQAARAGTRVPLVGLDQNQPLEIPMIQDAYGITPLDSCLGKLVRRSCYEGIFYGLGAEEAAQQAEVKNKTMASVIFGYIKEYSFMYMSSVAAVSNAVRDAIPGIGPFLESRFRPEAYEVQQTSFRSLQPRKKQVLKTKDGDSVITKEAGLCELDLWPRESKVKEELFTERGYFKPYKMKFYDLPHIVTQSLEGMEFIEALARTSDTSLFGLRSVQSIIHLHWMFWRKWEVFLRLIPFFAQILTFFLWSNFLLPTKAAEGSGWDRENVTLVAFLLLTGFWFLLIETLQFFAAPLDYVTRSLPSKLIEAVGVILLVYNALYSVVNTDQFTVAFWRIQALTSLFIYLRLLLILRYFEGISYLVGSLISVVKGMGAFLFVLVVAILAFTDAFISLDVTAKEGGEAEAARMLQGGAAPTGSEELTEAEKSWFTEIGLRYLFKVEVIYLLTNGEFPLGAVDTYDRFGWAIFALCTVFNLIIMLNLLITIISEVFAGVLASRDERVFEERVNSILALQRSFACCCRRKTNPVRLMFSANELAMDEIKTEDEHIDVISEKIEEIGDSIGTAHVSLDQMLADLDTTATTAEGLAERTKLKLGDQRSVLDSPGKLGKTASVLASPDKQQKGFSSVPSSESVEVFQEALLKELRELKRDIKLQSRTRV